MKVLQTVRAQRGVGSVLVVMVLFFVVSLMAAYASRNLIFEQKISANQARATMAFEAADAGIEWTLAQLNGGVMNGSCGDATPTDSFQQRYLTVDTYGNFTRRNRNPIDSWPTCVFNGTDWTCRCPSDAVLDPPDSTGNGPFPAFRVWPATKEPLSSAVAPYDPVTFPRPGMIAVGTAGCSVLPASAASNCLSFLPRGGFGEGVGTTRVYLALRSGLVVPPAAPVTARGTVTPSNANPAIKLKLVNEDEVSGGFTINSGGVANPLLFDAKTLGGTPGPASFADQDSRLVALNTVSTGPAPLSAGERMFVAVFGMKRQTYRDQPGLRVCRSPCDTAAVNALLANNPNRVIWVEGNLVVDGHTTIGTTAAPALLVIDGNTLTLGDDVRINGFVYLAGATSTVRLPSGDANIRGALVAEGDLVTTYAATPGPGEELTITYDAAVLSRLRTTYGSWVRVVGGWRDFKDTP
jgi:hypothetical protein